MYPFIDLYIAKIPMYSLMAAVGLLVAGFVFCWRIYKAGHDENDAVFFLLFVGAGMFFGGMIMYGIVNFGKYAHYIPKITNMQQFVAVFGSIFGGSVFYGGLIGAGLMGLLFIKIKKLPKELYLDNGALFGPLFHAFARVGCFFAGCCYGVESSFGFAVSESITTVTEVGHVCRFPVQLLESFLNLCIAGLIYFLMRKGIFKGKLVYVYLGTYSVVRFSDEFLRGDAVRGFVGPFSTSQFISMMMACFVLFMLFAYPAIKKKFFKKPDTKAVVAQEAVAEAENASESAQAQ